jgi:hypothetical protein
MRKGGFPILALMAVLSACGPAAADTITVDGITHKEVYVTESTTRYYIQVPSTGKTMSVAKTAVSPDSVEISRDETRRQALRREWQANSTSFTLESPTHDNHPSDAALAPRDRGGAAPRREAANPAVPPAPGPGIPLTENDYVTDGYVRPVKLENVKVRDALDALLRPLNLDYEARDGHLWISTSERIRREPSDRLEVRVYQLNHAGGEVLPKVGVSNLGGPGSAGPRGGIGTSSGSYGLSSASAYYGGSRRR